MRKNEAPVDIDPATILDGMVRCPCTRNGQICNALLGRLTSDAAQFYCDKCGIEAIVHKPVLSVQTDNGRRTSNMANPTSTTLLAILIDTESQAAATRARYADLLMYFAQNPQAA